MERGSRTPPFAAVQLVLYLLSLAAPASVWVGVVYEVVDPWFGAYLTVAIAITCWSAILVVPFVMAATRGQRLFSVLFYWGLIGGLFPIVWDGTWTIAHSWVHGITEHDRLMWYWWSYAKTDTRFLKSDPVMLIVETWSPVLGVVQLYCLHLLITGDAKRAESISWTCGWMQFYGCTLLFGMQLLNGHADITPGFLDCVMSFWVLNGFWLFMPFVACWCMSELRSRGCHYPRSWLDAFRGTLPTQKRQKKS